MKGDRAPWPVRYVIVRYRSTQRNVAGPDCRAKPIAIDNFAFDPIGVEQLVELLGKPADTAIDPAAVLQDIATQHYNWRKLPQPSKAEAAQGIALFAEFKPSTGSPASMRQEIAVQLAKMNDLSRPILWAAIERHARWSQIRNSPERTITAFEYLARDDIDLAFLSDCVSSCALQSRGDYPDGDLVLTVSDLVDFYGSYTGRRATYSTVTPGTSRASRCTEFIMAFFRLVEPGLAQPNRRMRCARK
jgi:hypothetical protein